MWTSGGGGGISDGTGLGDRGPTMRSHVSPQDEFEADSEGATCLSWNTSRFDTPMLLVGGCGKGHNVKVWGYNADYRKWEVYAEFGHKEVIHDVAWAPSVGRSYHLLASASKDRTLSMWKLTSEGGRVSVKLMDNRTDHNAEVRARARAGCGRACAACRPPAERSHTGGCVAQVWRVQWNVTGSVLASSGDDGMVRLWKLNVRRPLCGRVRDTGAVVAAGRSHVFDCVERSQGEDKWECQLELYGDNGEGGDDGGDDADVGMGGDATHLTGTGAGAGAGAGAGGGAGGVYRSAAGSQHSGAAGGYVASGAPGSGGGVGSSFGGARGSHGAAATPAWGSSDARALKR